MVRWYEVPNLFPRSYPYSKLLLICRPTWSYQIILGSITRWRLLSCLYIQRHLCTPGLIVDNELNSRRRRSCTAYPTCATMGSKRHKRGTTHNTTQVREKPHDFTLIWEILPKRVCVCVFFLVVKKMFLKLARQYNKSMFTLVRTVKIRS